MKDYITYIPDLDTFRAEIESKAEQVKDFAQLDEDGVTVVRIPKCKVSYNSTQSVSIARMNSEQLSACELIDSIDIIGEANDTKITCEADVSWKPYGKQKYLDICPLEITYTDEDGAEQTMTRPDVLSVVLG